jgi:tRNA threonylcarbamoyladenosine biosynthesis protein TsaB
VLILAVDTALDACQAALVRDGEALVVRSEPMVRGHQERLAPMVAECLACAGLRAAAIERIAVTTGPGSFTGLRVGLSFARGLALAIGRPVLGVGSLEALAASAGAGDREVVLAAIDARRGQLYLQPFRGGEALGPPAALAAEAAAGPADVLTGSGAAQLSDRFPGARLETRTVPDPLAVARLARFADPVERPARPLYVRAPDARTLAERQGR